MVYIRECKKAGYPARTEENVAAADITIAVAKDFNSKGEILTKNLCSKHNKLYIAVDYNIKQIDQIIIDDIIDKITALNSDCIIINIAGNGIYSLKETQEEVDAYMLELLMIIKSILYLKGITILYVRSGGQTGFDEAGSKAADKLNIGSLVLAPKGYTYRTKENKDISNSTEFIKRFR